MSVFFLSSFEEIRKFVLIASEGRETSWAAWAVLVVRAEEQVVLAHESATL